MEKVHSERILRRSGFSWGMREEEEGMARGGGAARLNAFL